MKRRIWTSEEEALLYKCYPHTETNDLAIMLGRSVSSVSQHAYLLGLYKTQECLRETGRNNCTHPAQKATQFKKGQRAWNTGKSYKPGGRAPETQFKKGQLPHNTKADGVITIRKDKRGVPNKFIRISLGKWEYLSRYTWRQANGPIPPGHCIIFADGDSMNCDIENLRCISRRENMERNTIQRYPQGVKSIIFLTKKLKRIIHEKQDQ